MESGDDTLLDLLRQWIVLKRDATVGKLCSPETGEEKLRYLQGELSSYRALQVVLSNPAEKLRRLIKDEMREETAKDE